MSERDKTRKWLAQAMERAFELHEVSWQPIGYRYELSWEQAAATACPNEPEWAHLVYLMCASGYSDYPEWAEANSGRRP